jgi:mRNA interferase RelE/StbE
MALFAVFFTPAAEKALRKLPNPLQRKIVTAVNELQYNPRPHGCVKLTGESDLWRIRVGDYRIVYTIQNQELVILVVRVGHRKDIYRK